MATTTPIDPAATLRKHREFEQLEAEITELWVISTPPPIASCGCSGNTIARKRSSATAS
jgi:hypothetical protein